MSFVEANQKVIWAKNWYLWWFEVLYVWTVGRMIIKNVFFRTNNIILIIILVIVICIILNIFVIIVIVIMTIVVSVLLMALDLYFYK